jgi:chromosome partitioning protein
MGYGIRVVLVMNRKGGSGKSTLCRALASAAAARGETVTIFDTDASKSCLKWMQAGKEAGNWSPLVEVIHTLDAHQVAEAIGQIYEQPDQEHLILIDTFGGGSEAQDVLAVAAQPQPPSVVPPLRLHAR